MGGSGQTKQLMWISVIDTTVFGHLSQLIKALSQIDYMQFPTLTVNW